MSIAFSGGFGFVNDRSGTVMADNDGEKDLVFYVEHDDWTVNAYDVNNDEIAWQIDYGDHVVTDPSGDNVFTDDTSGTDYFRLDAQSGEELATSDPGHNDNPRDIAINPTGDSVYVGLEDEIEIVDFETAEVKETVSIEFEPRSLDILDDTIYYSNFDGDIYKSGTDISDPELVTDELDTDHNSEVLAGNDENVVFVSGETSIYKVDGSTGDVIWSGTYSDPGIPELSPEGDSLYFADESEENLYKLDSESGMEEWSASVSGIDGDGVPQIDNSLFVGTTDGVFYDIESDSGEILETYETDHGGVSALDSTATVDDKDPITGQVTDQHGDRVDQSNITVEAWGVDEPALDEADLGDLEDEIDRAEDLADELENAVPEDYDEFTDDYAADDTHLDTLEWEREIDGTYPLVHAEEDWALGTRTVISSSVDDPRIQIDEGETVTLSLWDPAEGGGWIDNQVDNSFPGAVTEGTIVVEQVDPLGDTIDTRELETSPVYETTGANPLSTNDHHVAQTQLPTGVYQAHPEGEPEKAYTFVVGDPEDLAADYAGDLLDRADRLEQRFDMGENALEETIVRERTTTNETGQFELDLPSGPDEYNIQAYRADDAILEHTDPEDLADLSLEDLRDYRFTEYEGAFILPAETGTVDAGEQDAEVQVIRTDEMPWDDMEQYEDLMERLEDEFLNSTVDDLADDWDELVDELDDERLEELTEQYRAIVEGDEDLEDAIEETIDRELGDDNETEALREELEAIRDELDEVDDRVNIGDGEIEIDDGEADAWFPVPDWVDESDVLVEYQTADGEVEAIDDEYVSLASDGVGPFGGQQVVVEDFPVDEDVAAADFRLEIVGDEGYGSGSVGFATPGFDGTVPDVRAIDLNTHSPGPDESVSMTVRPAAGERIDGITGIDAYGPDDEPLANAEITDDDRATIRTDGAGEHFVRLSIDTGAGGEYVKSFTLEAGEEARSNPPTVRTEQSVGDQRWALTGEGLADGAVATDDDQLDVRAIAPADDVPGAVHVRPDDALDETDRLSVRVLEGADERQVANNIETVVHIDDDLEGATVWRGEPSWLGGDPLVVDDTTRHGEIDVRGEDGDKTVIRTFTEDDGTLELHIDDDPGFIASTQHSVATTVPSPSLPLLSIAGTGVTAGLTIGVALFTRRRVAA